jgi:hypothetical protein
MAFPFGHQGAGAGPWGNFQFPADLIESMQHQVFENVHQHQQAEEEQAADGKVPPAAARVIRTLPEVAITKADLDAEATNSECAICLEPQIVGNAATKLPCAHLFCRDCIVDWLRKNCTCPVCRYELETDAASYERERKERMKERKPRYRKQQLESQPVGDLRRLMRSLELSFEDCIEKRDMLSRILSSGKVEIIPDDEACAETYSAEELLAMPVENLRRLMRTYGLSAPSEGLSAAELVQLIHASGRVQVVGDVAAAVARFVATHGNAAPAAKPAAGATGSFGSATGSALPPDLEKRSVGELKRLMKERGVDMSGCVEKGDLVKRLRGEA